MDFAIASIVVGSTVAGTAIGTTVFLNRKNMKTFRKVAIARMFLIQMSYTLKSEEHKTRPVQQRRKHNATSLSKVTNSKSSKL
jgi:hypothetical protein